MQALRTRFEPPDAQAGAPAQMPAQDAYSAAAPRRRGWSDLISWQLRKDLEGRLFARRSASAFAANAAGPPSVRGHDRWRRHRSGASRFRIGGCRRARRSGPQRLRRPGDEHGRGETRPWWTTIRMTDLAPDSMPVNVHYTGHISVLVADAKRSTVAMRDFDRPLQDHGRHPGSPGARLVSRAAEAPPRAEQQSYPGQLQRLPDGRRDPSPAPLDLLPNVTPSPANQIGVLEQVGPAQFCRPAKLCRLCNCMVLAGPCEKRVLRPADGSWSYFSVGSQPLDAVHDMQVGKSGRTTQLTTGGIVDVNASISVSYGNGRVANFSDQITITESGTCLLGWWRLWARSSGPGTKPASRRAIVCRWA